MKGRAAYEWVLVTIVVILTVILGLGLYSGRDKVQKSKMLIQELGVMRAGIAHYKMINKKVPSSLEELATATHGAKGNEKPFIEGLHIGEDKTVIDPFGNSYKYDPKIGWVSSQTAGFERW